MSDVLLKDAVFSLLGDDKQTPVTGYGSIISTEQDGGNLISNAYLANGDYYLKEIASPAGYNALEYMLKIHVDEVRISMMTDTAYAPANYTDKTATDDLVYTFNVVNNPGVELPSTGGPGTALFTAIGGIMTILAGAVLTLKKRKEHA